LPAFADAAKDTGIQVWVYLVPWSETPDKDPSFSYPAPFKTDYIAWADAIGQLSLSHANITAWVMDDFYINAVQPDRFTNQYVDRMLDAGKAQNPKLKFFPVVYFQQPWSDFVRRFALRVDGVIACYPRSSQEIDQAWNYLNGKSYGPSLLASFGRKSKVKAGNQAYAISQVRAPFGSHLRFFFDDQTFGDETGEHIAFVRVNGNTIWWHHLGNDKEDQDVDVPLPDTNGGLTVVAGVQVARMETGALVQARLDDIRVVNRDGDRVDSVSHGYANTGMHAVLTPGSPDENDLHIPMILLVATLPEEHAKRYQEAPTLQNIQSKLHGAVDCVEKKEAAGVVCWYTPKQDASPLAPIVHDEFGRLIQSFKTTKVELSQ
jgi:hypothetical protein